MGKWRWLGVLVCQPKLILYGGIEPGGYGGLGEVVFVFGGDPFF
jgi:hypothetical protein